MKNKILSLLFIVICLFTTSCGKKPLKLNAEFKESEKIDKFLSITITEIYTIDNFEGIVPDDGNIFLKIKVLIKDYKNESGKQYIVKTKNFDIVKKSNKNKSIAILKSDFSDVEIMPGQEKELELVFSMREEHLKYTKCAFEFDISNLPGYNTYIPLNYYY